LQKEKWHHEGLAGCSAVLDRALFVFEEERVAV
jgi:hypothetical protein